MWENENQIWKMHACKEAMTREGFFFCVDKRRIPAENKNHVLRGVYGDRFLKKRKFKSIELVQAKKHLY